MADIKDKLELLGVMRGEQWRRNLEQLAKERAEGLYEIDKLLPGQAVGEEGIRFYLVRTDYPLDACHGNTQLGAALRALPEHIAVSAADAELAGFDPSKAFFVDTETTGLTGGTGAVAFLVGVGHFLEDRFRLEQCFMRDYDEEEPMLRYLDGLFSNCGAVVSYNGKSFDMPLVATRFIANRIPFKLEGVPHFDLLHVMRRFCKLRLGDCTLGNVERTILNVERHGDVSSELIPQTYFDYLRTRDARPLSRVFYHHAYDILSLVGLTAWVSQSLAAPCGEGFEHVEDRLGLLRLHINQKHYEDAIRHESLRLLALAHKRLKDFEQMGEVLERLVGEFPRDLDARLELAKLHEHRTRNLAEAERLCVEAVDFLEVRMALERGTGIESARLIEFRRRLDRIRRKMGRHGGGGEMD